MSSQFAKGYQPLLFYSIPPISMTLILCSNIQSPFFSWTYFEQGQSFYWKLKFNPFSTGKIDIYIQFMLKGYFFPPNMTICPYKRLVMASCNVKYFTNKRCTLYSFLWISKICVLCSIWNVNIKARDVFRNLSNIPS